MFDLEIETKVVQLKFHRDSTTDFSKCYIFIYKRQYRVEMSSKESKGLTIKKQWLDLILEGKKKWEIRSMSCKVRGQIGLVRSQVKKGDPCLWLGTAEIVDCKKLSMQDFKESLDKHCVSIEDLKILSKGKKKKIDDIKLFAWVITNVRVFEKPVVVQRKPGAVNWIKIASPIPPQ
jgi:hypothetical protein